MLWPFTSARSYFCCCPLFFYVGLLHGGLLRLSRHGDVRPHAARAPRDARLAPRRRRPARGPAADLRRLGARPPSGRRASGRQTRQLPLQPFPGLGQESGSERLPGQALRLWSVGVRLGGPPQGVLRHGAVHVTRDADPTRLRVADRHLVGGRHHAHLVDGILPVHPARCLVRKHEGHDQAGQGEDLFPTQGRPSGEGEANPSGDLWRSASDEVGAGPRPCKKTSSQGGLAACVVLRFEGRRLLVLSVPHGGEADRRLRHSGSRAAQAQRRLLLCQPKGLDGGHRNKASQAQRHPLAAAAGAAAAVDGWDLGVRPSALCGQTTSATL
mmetsp:Transcript_113383/g.366796  ORF Transcript_113383/g.366796 Transcript_113383/m.366796 type:complete len:327 (-) Transcript_113383:31-1011(-)